MISIMDVYKSNKPFLELIQILSPNYCENEPVPDADWVLIIEYAKEMQVIPLLFFMLKQKTGITPPADINNQLKSIYLANSNRNLFLTYDLIRILNLLDKNAIPAIPLKGAYLAHVVYEGPSARHMTDLDIMVRWEDITKAVVLLETLGYVINEKYKINEEYRRSNHHLPIFTHSSGTIVEIHWNILKPLNKSESGKVIEEILWLQAKPGDIMGAKAYVMTPEFLIIHSAIHLTMHHLFNLGIRDFYDVEHIYRKFRGDINWEFLISSAKKIKLERPVLLTLALTDIITGSDILDELNKKGINCQIPSQYLRDSLEMVVQGGPIYNVSLRGVKKNPGLLAIVNTTVNRILISRKMVGMKYRIRADSLMIYLYYPKYLYDLYLRYGLDLFREALYLDYKKEHQGFWEWMIET